jgi:hypothetical protein
VPLLLDNAAVPLLRCAVAWHHAMMAGFAEGCPCWHVCGQAEQLPQTYTSNGFWVTSYVEYALPYRTATGCTRVQPNQLLFSLSNQIGVKSDTCGCYDRVLHNLHVLQH